MRSVLCRIAVTACGKDSYVRERILDETRTAIERKNAGNNRISYSEQSNLQKSF